MELSKLMLAVMAASSLTLTACGGSGSSSDNNNQELPGDNTDDSTDDNTDDNSSYLTGTAATGLAMDGTVYVYDADGRSTNVVIEDDGSFSVNVDGMTPPFMLEARPDDTSLAIQYSFAEAADITVNVTPLTTLALFLANDQQSLAALLSAWDDEAETFDATALAAAEQVILANFADQFEEQNIDPATYDLFNNIFNADQTGFDAVLDDVKIVFDMNGGSFEVDVDETDYVFDNTASLDDDDNPDGNGGDNNPDTTPDSFSFTAATDVEPSTRVTSAVVTLAGFDDSLTLTVSNGSLLLNGNAAGASASVSAGDQIQIVHTSSSAFATTVTSTVTLGDVSASFTSTTRVADTTPENISFSALTDVEPATSVESNLVTLAGFEGTLPLSVSNGSLLVNNTASGTSASVSAGDQIQIIHTSSADFSTSVTSTVTLGSVTTDFTSTTRAIDITPDSFAFTTLINREPNATVITGPVTLAGFDGELTISVDSGASLIINGSNAGNSALVSAGDTVRVVQQASSAYDTEVVNTLTLGNLTVSVTIRTRTADTSANSFSFSAQSDVEPGTVVSSNVVSLAGFDETLALTVANGSVTVNGSAVSSPVQVAAGDDIQVSHTSSSDFDSSVTTTVSLGGVSASFTSTTRSADTTPASISFTPLMDVEPATALQSNLITLAGFDGSLTATVTNGELIVNGSNAGTSASVSAGDQIKLAHTSSSDFGTQLTSSLTVGTTTASFTSTTRVADTTPDNVSFSSLDEQQPATQVYSNAVTLNGFDGNASASVSNGELQVNGGSWTSSASVATGDSVRLRQLTSSAYATTSVTVLTVNSSSFNFSTTTKAQDVTPASFSFTAQADVDPATLVTSNSVTVTGFDGPLPLTVSGGTIHYNGTAYTSSVNVQPGDSFTVSHTSASDPEQVTTSTVTLGNYSADFTSTTRAADTTPDTVVFDSVTDASMNRLIYSNSVTLTGFDGNASISVNNGYYELDGSGSWVNSSATITAGTQIMLRANTASGYGATTTVTLLVNGTPFTFDVTTVAAPTPVLGSQLYHLIDGTIVDPGYTSTADEQWLNVKDQMEQGAEVEVRYSVDSAVQGTPINVYNGEYSLNYTNVWHQGTATSPTDIGSYSHTVTSDDLVKVRHFTASNDRETVETTVIIGGTNGAGIATDTFTTRTYDVDFFKVPVIDSSWSVGADDVVGLEVPIGYEQTDITDDFPIYTLKSTASGTTLMKGQMTSNSGTVDQAAVSGFDNFNSGDMTALKVSDTDALLFGCHNVTNQRANVYLALESSPNAGIHLALTNVSNWEITSCQNLTITDLVQNGSDISFTLVAAGEGTNNGTSAYLISTTDFTYDTSATGYLTNRVTRTVPSLLTQVDTTNRTVLAMGAIDSNNVVYAISQPIEAYNGTSALYHYKAADGSTDQLIGSNVEPFNNWNGVTWTVDDIFVWNKPNDPQIYLVSGNRGVIKVTPDNNNLSDFDVLSGGSTCIDGITGIPADDKITLYCHDRDGDPSHIINFDDQ